MVLQCLFDLDRVSRFLILHQIRNKHKQISVTRIGLEPTTPVLSGSRYFKPESACSPWWEQLSVPQQIPSWCVEVTNVVLLRWNSPSKPKQINCLLVFEMIRTPRSKRHRDLTRRRVIGQIGNEERILRGIHDALCCPIHLNKANNIETYFKRLWSDEAFSSS
jgi:hypothetical protein